MLRGEKEVSKGYIQILFNSLSYKAGQTKHTFYRDIYAYGFGPPIKKSKEINKSLFKVYLHKRRAGRGGLSKGYIEESRRMVMFYFFSFISFNRYLLNAYYVPSTATSICCTIAPRGEYIP